MIFTSAMLPVTALAFEDDPWTERKSWRQNDEERSGYLSPRVSGGIYSGNDFSSIESGGIAFGYDINDKQSLELDFALARVETNDGGRVTSLFDNDADILYAAINYRYFFTERHAFPGAYLVLGLAYNGLNWDYKKGVKDQAGKEMAGDDLDGTEISIGLGATLFSANNIDIRVELIPSVILWEDKTDKGLDHNFNPTQAIRLRFACDFYLPD